MNQAKIVNFADKKIPRVGLGCMGMSDFYAPCDAETALRTLHEAYSLGYRHFDTADMYGNGENEKLLGRFLSELGTNRNDVLVATKVGIKRLDGPKPAIAIDSSPEHVRAAVDASLQRLGVEQIGLLYLHRKSPNVPIEDTIGALAELVKSGKVRHIGLSEVSVDTLERALKVSPICALQSEYSLWSRDVENGMLDVCQRNGVAFVAYSPLGRGFLTGNFERPAQGSRDLRAFLPRFQGDNFDANMRLVDAVRDIASDIGATAAQVALAWVLAQADNIHVIPGTTKSERLTNNFASLEISLSPAQLARLAEIFNQDAVKGERYPAEVLKTVNV